jgi:hypothetical protein
MKVSEGSAKKTGKKLNEFNSDHFKDTPSKKLRMLEDLEAGNRWAGKRERKEVQAYTPQKT